MLKQRRDLGVDSEESEYAFQAILDLHGPLPVAIGEMLDQGRCDEGGRKAILDGVARVAIMEVRYFREAFATLSV